MELLCPVAVVLLNLVLIGNYLILVSYHRLKSCYIFGSQLTELIVSRYFNSAKARSCILCDHYFYFKDVKYL